MKLRRWVVIGPDGAIWSRHLTYRGAFYEARGKQLKHGGWWWTRRH